MNRVKILLCLLCFMLLLQTAVGQETTAGLQGTVKDATGAVVSKAVVEVTGTSLIGAKTAETDASGYYRFANLPPGVYTISASAQGFKGLKRQGINLEVGKLPTIDLVLEIGTKEQVVEVLAAAPIVDVTQSKVQTNIASNIIDSIPKGRSFQSVIQLAPGARQEPLMGNGFQIDGASNAENAYLVEGQDTGSIQTGVSAANVPFEFVEEVQIKSGGFEAEYGGALGGVVNVIQKRGGNTWHGSVFTYYQGDMFNAAPNRYLRTIPGSTLGQFQADPNGNGRADYPTEWYQPKKDRSRTVEPGFEAGGYVKKDRLWLFASFVPRVYTLERWVNWNYKGTPGSNAVDSIGPRRFTQGENTYYSLTRADFLLTQKIRLYGAWQNQYDVGRGYSSQTNNTILSNLPNADDVFGKFNNSAGGNYTGGVLGSTNGQPPDNYVGTMGYKAPNVIYNTGADITITPNLIATSRFGYFYTDLQTRGNPTGNRYSWGVASTSASIRQLGVGDNCYYGDCGAGANTGYRDGVAPTLAATFPNAAHPSGYATIASPYDIARNKYWRKSFNQDIAYFKRGFFGTHNFKGGYALNALSNDALGGFDGTWTRLYYGRPYYASGTDQVANCAAVNTYNNATYGTNFYIANPAVDVFDTCGGKWGYVSLRDISVKGKVSSMNHALYVQDAWTAGAGVTLNLGIRMDKEALPNYATALSNFKGISFGFGQKIAPRLGASWDVFRTGKFKVYGSYGYFFDIMKYELPRGSFGGDYWHDCIYALDSPDYSLILPTKTTEPLGHSVYCNPTLGANGAVGNPDRLGIAGAGANGLIANIDYRKPSNDATDYRIDPNLKPMKQHEMTVGADWQINPTYSLETRYTRKRLDRTIEDAGYLDQTGSEPFYIVNPGEGIHKYGLVPETDCPAGECKAQPKAVRNYDALEVRLTKKASAKWMGVLSYTYSRLWGNYGGLTSAEVSDGGSNTAVGGGRLSPNVSRAFDEPMMQFDAHGNATMGMLPTDRPHTIKAYGFYRLKWLGMETLLGGTQFIFSGTPISSYITASNNAGVPVFVEGRGKWIDMHRDESTGNIVVDAIRERRTPTYSQTDLNLSHELKVSKTNEAMRLGFEANVINLFNQRTAVAYYSQMINDVAYLEPNLHVPATSKSNFDYPSFLKYGFDWVAVANNNGLYTSSTYGKEAQFQGGRSMRFKVKFTF